MLKFIFLTIFSVNQSVKFFKYKVGLLKTADNKETIIEKITYVYSGTVLMLSQSSVDGYVRYTNDNMGNPIKIQKDGTTYTLTWGEGRMLKGISKDTSNGVTYSYNVDGLRTQKVVKENGVSTVTEYVWGNNGLAGMQTELGTVVVLYDAEGQPVGFSLNNEVYHYVKNLQGDVVRILDETGNTVVEYSYDPWGVPTVTGDTELAKINPCSYRGYDYDEETGYYYLYRRYYNPEVGRFVSVDNSEILFEHQDNMLQYNLYAYCFNNPINMLDYTGESPANIIGGLLGAVGGAIIGILLAQALGWTGTKRNALIIAATIGGIALGAILGPYIAKYGSKMVQILNSTLRKASNAAFKAAKRVNNFTVSAKHLSNAGGRYRKFNTTSQSQIRTWVKEALKSKNATFYYNTDESYYIIVNMGKTIGTKGERCIKVVFDNAGKIWTAYPSK